MKRHSGLSSRRRIFPSRPMSLLVAILGLRRLPLSTTARNVSDTNRTDTTAPLDCYVNTADIYVDVLAADSSIPRTYVICPDTVIDIRDDDLDLSPGPLPNNTFEGGKQPAIYLRSQSTVMCGTDGKSSNNCTLRGGILQFAFLNGWFGDEVARNVRVLGLTFEAADFVSTALNRRGDITFIDCIWKNHHSAAAIVFITYNGPIYTLETTFENCRFENNRQGDVSQGGIPVLGIVYIPVPFVPTVFRNCTFAGNTFDGSDGNTNGYAIQSVGSPLQVHDCCLVNNSFIGFGPVQVFGSPTFESSGNYVTEDELVYCDYAAVTPSFTPRDFTAITCRAAEREDGCGPHDNMPTDTRGDTPTTAPSSSTPALTPTESAAAVRTRGGGLMRLYSLVVATLFLV